MKEYHKIQTLFKRDEKTKRIIEGDFTYPVFEMLKDLKWVGTEKIDGTNIRVIWDGKDVTFKGRTERAELPKHLKEKLEKMFTKGLMESIFPQKTSDSTPMKVCLYGEGYGKKIQKGGNYIPDNVSFILFDIKIGEWWLTREACEELSKQLEISIVPIIGEFTIDEAIEFVRKGFKSTISHNKDYEAEGLVLKPKHDLFMRNGNRVITKIKHVDFK